MILTLALSLAASTPEDAISRSMEDYTECLRVEAGSGEFSRQSAYERTAFAMAQCRSRRDATTRLAVELLSPRFGAENVRSRMEQALAGVEQIFPALLRAGGGVKIPPGIAPMVRRYVDCLGDQMEQRNAYQHGSVAAYGAAVEAAIASCATVRAEAVAESEASLASDSEYHDPARRNAAIQRAFDETDAQQRNLLEIMDSVRRELANASN